MRMNRKGLSLFVRGVAKLTDQAMPIVISSALLSVTALMDRRGQATGGAPDRLKADNVLSSLSTAKYAGRYSLAGGQTKSTALSLALAKHMMHVIPNGIGKEQRTRNTDAEPEFGNYPSRSLIAEKFVKETEAGAYYVDARWI